MGIAVEASAPTGAPDVVDDKRASLPRVRVRWGSAAGLFECGARAPSTRSSTGRCIRKDFCSKPLFPVSQTRFPKEHIAKERET